MPASAQGAPFFTADMARSAARGERLPSSGRPRRTSRAPSSPKRGDRRAFAGIGREGADVQLFMRRAPRRCARRSPKLPRRLIGERHRRYAEGFAPVLQQAHDALYEREGLARARPGDDRQRGGFRLHGAALFLVEAGAAPNAFPRQAPAWADASPETDSGFWGATAMSNIAICPPSTSSSPAQRGNDAVFAVIAAFAQHPARAQAADALQRPTPGGADVAKGTFAQYVQFIAQRGKQREVALATRARGGDAHAGGQHFPGSGIRLSIGLPPAGMGAALRAVG